MPLAWWKIGHRSLTNAIPLKKGNQKKKSNSFPFWCRNAKTEAKFQAVRRREECVSKHDPNGESKNRRINRTSVKHPLCLAKVRCFAKSTLQIGNSRTTIGIGLARQPTRQESHTRKKDNNFFQERTKVDDANRLTERERERENWDKGRRESVFKNTKRWESCDVLGG